MCIRDRSKGILDNAYQARNEAYYVQYKAGTMNIDEFLDFSSSR